MEKITTYVENLFYSFPKTEEVARLKMQIIDSMNERYSALLSDGKNEHEAFGIIVSEFGSLDELKKDFNFTETAREDFSKTSEMNAQPQQKKSTADTTQMQQAYLEHQKAFGKKIAIGVMFCILAIILSTSAGQFAPRNLKSVLTTVAFFIPVAIGVFIFITANVEHEAFKNITFTESESIYLKQNRYTESISAIIMSLATIIFLMLGFTNQLWHPGWIVFPIAGLLCALAGIIISMSEKNK